MRPLLSHITFEKFDIRFVANIEIESAWDKLTTTCKITLPRAITFKDSDGNVVGVDGAIKRGDKVRVEFGYDTLTKKHYDKTFYVARVRNNVPVEIELEDEMFLLKKGKVTKSLKNAKLSDVLLACGLNNSAPELDIEIGDIRLDQLSPAAVLDKLRKDYNIKSYYKDGKFYAGLAFYPALQKEIAVIMQEDVVENTLEYLNKEERYIHVTAVSVLKVLKKTKKGTATKNKTIKVGLGDVDGEEHTMHFYNITSESALKRMAEQELERFKYSGYSGSIKTFGYPLVGFGDKVTFDDKLYTDRTSTYLIKSVKTTFGVDGYRQELEIYSRVL